MTLVNVSLAEDTKLPEPYSSLDVAKAGSYSYHLYLPPGYYEQPAWHYPALFIMSPDGNASLGKFKERAHDEGWIVVMFVEAKNGPWGPIYGDMLATYADVVGKGLRIQDGLRFAAGFSGGSRGSSMLTQFCPGFNGEFLQGAGFAFADSISDYHVAGVPRDHPYAVFMAMGGKDSNIKEIVELKSQLHDIPFKAVTFDGGHVAPPQEVFDQGLDWLMVQAFSGDTIADDLRETGTRQFGFLAKRWNAETDATQKAGDASPLAGMGDKLNLPPGSDAAAALQTIKNAVPLNP